MENPEGQNKFSGFHLLLMGPLQLDICFWAATNSRTHSSCPVLQNFYIQGIFLRSFQGIPLTVVWNLNPWSGTQGVERFINAVL